MGVRMDVCDENLHKRKCVLILCVTSVCITLIYPSFLSPSFLSIPACHPLHPPPFLPHRASRYPSAQEW